MGRVCFQTQLTVGRTQFLEGPLLLACCWLEASSMSIPGHVGMSNTATCFFKVCTLRRRWRKSARKMKVSASYHLTVIIALFLQKQVIGPAYTQQERLKQRYEDQARTIWSRLGCCLVKRLNVTISHLGLVPLSALASSALTSTSGWFSYGSKTASKCN